MNDIPEKRGPGRPRKTFEEKQAERLGKVEAMKATRAAFDPGLDKAPAKTTPKYKMKAKPNWEEVDPSADETPDRFRIPLDMIPDGFSLQWVTISVLGQVDPQDRSRFERGGWTPVHQEDFDARFNGMFMAKNEEGEINVGGLVLMARPIEYTQKAQLREKQKAREQIAIKERDMLGGNLPSVTLDAQHKSALQTNKISRSYERIQVPED